MASNPFRILLLLLALPLFTNCRVDLPEDDTSLASTSQTGWVDSYGDAGICEPPASSCTQVDHDKEFVDRCVKAGFQAKTCGCSVKCSGVIDYKRQRVALSTGEGDSDACSANDVSYLSQVKSTLIKTKELSDCINGHVCQGHTVYCTQSDAEVSRHIRSLAQQKCADQVDQLFCPNGHANSWSCPDAVVDTLSREWAKAFQSDDKQLRECFQDYVCNNTERRCASANLLDRARTIKAALGAESCSYWYESFCRLGKESPL